MIKVLWIFFFLYSSLYAMEPTEAINKLMEGNDRFRKNKMLHPNQDASRRQAVSKSQSPFAIIVACSDSRVSPEVLFDQGIGDLFVIRVAGNVIGPLEMESINYAAKYLGSSCIIVMGHENCGAVDAVVQQHTDDVRFIAQLIQPSVEQAKRYHSHNHLLEAAIKENADRMRAFVSSGPIVSHLIGQKKIAVRAAYYHFQTGAVELLASAQKQKR